MTAPVEQTIRSDGSHWFLVGDDLPDRERIQKAEQYASHPLIYGPSQTVHDHCYGEECVGGCRHDHDEGNPCRSTCQHKHPKGGRCIIGCFELSLRQAIRQSDGSMAYPRVPLT